MFSCFLIHSNRKSHEKALEGGLKLSGMAKKRKVFPYHLLITAILPVISLYAHNLEQVVLMDTLRAYAVFLLSALVCLTILLLFVRRFHYVALVVSYGLILFYAVMPLQEVLINAHMEDVARIRYLFPFFTLIFIIGIWVIAEKIKDPEPVTKILNKIALLTLILPIFQISSHLIYGAPRIEQNTRRTIEAHMSSAKNARFLPDVYLIILDAHARSDDIKREFAYDNTIILEQLTRMGFYIAQCSNANYPDATWQSMYATLNMRFFDHVQVKTQSPTQTINNAFSGIKNSEVINMFQELGYVIVSFNTTYDFLNLTDADVYYDFVYFPNTDIPAFNRFESQLLDKTPVGLLIDKTISSEKIHYDNVQQVLRKLPQIPQEVSSPKFIYAHIVVPHFPYVFSPTGEYLAEDQDKFTAQKYVDQVAYIDGQIVAIVKKLIENSSTLPIIILQGDHGFPASGIQPGAMGNSTGILNAYYFPSIDYSENFYPTISPVNSFRLLFNLYFDERMSLLPDDIYRDNLGSDREHLNRNIPYDFAYYSERHNCSKGN
jgi:hypothetical protein